MQIYICVPLCIHTCKHACDTLEHTHTQIKKHMLWHTPRHTLVYTEFLFFIRILTLSIDFKICSTSNVKQQCHSFMYTILLCCATEKVIYPSCWLESTKNVRSLPGSDLTYKGHSISPTISLERHTSVRFHQFPFTLQPHSPRRNLTAFSAGGYIPFCLMMKKSGFFLIGKYLGGDSKMSCATL